MIKKVLITQSNYIPWKGYFDAINMADEFIIYDDMQYTKNDWRNRNMIKTPTGPTWLTIPIDISGNHFKKINEMFVSNKYNNWNKKHWQSLLHNYSKSQYFTEIQYFLKPLYFNCNETNLSKINSYFLRAICDYLGINTRITNSGEFDLKGDRSEKLLNICKELNASHYLSGPSAKAYLNQEIFLENNIVIEWLNNDNYKEYNQLFPPFKHRVSILDLIFNCGPDSKKYLKSFNDYNFNYWRR
jgi:hypothetical protein